MIVSLYQWTVSMATMWSQDDDPTAGTLHFAHNKPQDATTYACTLAPRWARAGIYSPFARLIITSHSKLAAFAPRIDEYHPQVFPEVPIVGHDVLIECVGYAK